MGLTDKHLVYGDDIPQTQEEKYYYWALKDLKEKQQEPCEDAVSRQAVLNTLDKMDKALDDDRTVESYKELLTECYKDLTPVMPKERMDWIPINEGLPKLHEEVIVTDIETSDTYISRYIGNGYWECDNGPFNNRIIAWMPKPKPYKAESEDKE